MKVATILFLLAGAFAQNSLPSQDSLPSVDNVDNTEGNVRIKGLMGAVAKHVSDALTLAGYSIPPGVGTEEWKTAKKAAVADGFDLQAIEEEAIKTFLEQGVTDGTIDAVTAAAYLAKRAQKQEMRGEKQDRREVKQEVKAIADAVKDAQDAVLREGGFLQEESTKEDRKAAVKQATAAGIDLNAIAAELIDKLLSTVDSDVAAGYASKVEKVEEKKQEKKQAKEEKQEARQQAKQQKQEARQEKQQLRVVRREVGEAIKIAQDAALGSVVSGEDRKTVKKRAQDQGIDLDAVREEATAKYLASVDTDLAAAYTANMEAKRSKKAAEREAKKQAKRDKKATEKKARKEKKAAEKQAKKDKKAAEKKAKKDKKADEKKAKKERKKQSKVADRLQKKVKSSNKD